MLNSEGGKPEALGPEALRPVSAARMSARSSASSAPVPRRRAKFGKQFWMKQLHSWHWVSAALSLIGMFLFAVTGITLNHAASISAEPQVTERTAVLRRPLLEVLNQPGAIAGPLPEAVAEELEDLVELNSSGLPAEWSEEEVYVPLPGPGSDAWISIDRATGAVIAEHTDRGWISYLNDLHKGRNTGTAWFWFIDIFAVACIVFTLTGLLLLQVHAKRRPLTWPIVALGAALPMIIAMFFLHT